MTTKSNVFDKGIVLILTIRKPGMRRKVSTDQINVKEENGEKTDKSLLHLSKEILACKEYDAISSLDNDVKNNKLTPISLPAPFLRAGWIIPFTNLDAADTIIQEYQQQRTNLVDTFLKVYTDAKSAARKRLGNLYNDEDYPSTEVVAASFGIIVSYIDFRVPVSLEGVNKAIYEREQKVFEEKLEVAADEIRLYLRDAFRELVAHMTDKLTPNEDGKKKIFRDASIRNLKEFIEGFTSRNIADDGELDKLVSDASALLGGIAPDELRTQDAVRSEVQKGLETIKESLESMIASAPRRKFNLD